MYFNLGIILIGLKGLRSLVVWLFSYIISFSRGLCTELYLCLNMELFMIIRIMVGIFFFGV